MSYTLSEKPYQPKYMDLVKHTEKKITSLINKWAYIKIEVFQTSVYAF